MMNERVVQPDCVPLGFRSAHCKAIKYRLDGSPLIGPEKRKKKAIRTARCLSDSEFRAVPLFSEHRRNRPIVGVAFFGLPFLAKQKR
jgi:hypothetical protein